MDLASRRRVSASPRSSERDAMKNHHDQEPSSGDLGPTTTHAAMLRHWIDGWKDVFRSGAIGQDVLAGITVAAVALPLNVALAVVSGVPPIAGLVAGALGGFIAAAFGGSALQVSGPAAALSTLVLAIAARYGTTGVAAAAVMCGVILVTLGLLKMGRFAKLVPHSVLAGFTTGVGLKLLDGQIPELLGFEMTVGDIASMMHRPAWLHQVSWLAVVCGLFVAFFIITTRPVKRFPGAIVALAIVTFVSVYLSWDLPRVGMIPSTLPTFSIPLMRDEEWLDLLIMTLPLGLLVGVESLLSGKAVDDMRRDVRPLEPNVELVGMGIANFVVGFFGGMTVSGVVVRSSVNAQSGGKTRLSAMVHGVVLAGAVLLAAQHLARIPLPALAGLLCVTGVRLLAFSELKHLLAHDRIQAVAFFAAAAGTMTGHLLTGLIAGFAISFFGSWLRKSQKGAAEAPKITVARSKQDADRGIRAVLPNERAAARRKAMDDLPKHQQWLANIRQEPLIPPTTFVHEQAAVIGNVVLGDHVNVAPGASIRADEGSPFFLGDNTNVQDAVVIHALKDKWVKVGDEEWAVYIGRNCSLAHDALIHGPSYLGDETFVGFKAIVHDSVVGSHCFVGHGAIVAGVEIPDGRFVPPGTIVTSQDAVDALPPAQEAHGHFNEDVVDVNRGLAAAYHSADKRLRDARALARSPVKTASWDVAWDRPTRNELAERF
jgi:SulP family sulfate permease